MKPNTPLLLAEGRNQEALDLFSRKEFEGSFHTATYLEALAWLRVGEQEKGQNALVSGLRCVPEVARYLLGCNAAAPSEGITLQGIGCGSPYEGWRCAARYRRLWAEPPHGDPAGCRRTCRQGWLDDGSGRRRSIVSVGPLARQVRTADRDVRGFPPRVSETAPSGLPWIEVQGKSTVRTR
jgi:hypothetical protein